MERVGGSRISDRVKIARAVTAYQKTKGFGEGQLTYETLQSLGVTVK